MNFKVIENSYVDWETICDEFTDDFLHSELDNKELKEKYGMSHGEFKQYCNIVKMNHNLTRRPFWKHRKGKAKYYYKVKNGFIICKRYGNDYVYLGFVSSLKVAEQLVEMCKNLSWDRELCQKLCHEWDKV